MDTQNKQIPASIPLYPQDHLAAKGFFYVGGQYERQNDGRHLMYGQMYVEVYEPKEVKRPVPLVLFHGAGQTAVNWMGTPDGRPGWLDLFLRMGYVVYLVDQPARGRSVYHPSKNGALKYMSAEQCRKTFANQIPTHTQWPGRYADEDAVFDAFYASQVEFITDTQLGQQMVLNAGKQLLEMLGKAVLIAHSQAGPFGWVLGDACPDQVAALVEIEPSGPPFANWYPLHGRCRPYGLTEIPLRYDPPINPPEWWRDVEKPIPPIERANDWLQQEPAGQLVNLLKIPQLLLTAEASYHQEYDCVTAAYLKQAGVPVDAVSLPNICIHGNGHMMMLEKNNAEIAEYIDSWLIARI